MPSLSQTLVVAFSVAALVVSGITWSQRQEAAAVAPVQKAHDLSVAFRQVAAEVLPSVVSIQTRTKPRELPADESPFFDDDFPFRDFFRNDPRLREFFRGPGLRRRIPQQEGMGSGFIIDSSGVIMTNNHVVRGADEVIVTLQDGRKFVAKDIKTDPRTDVAIVRIEGADNLKPVRLGDSQQVQVGDWVLAVGNPFGFDLSVTAGIISAKGRGIGAVQREDFLQTDAAMNPGNSGGPLLNLDGEVIGVNTAISSRSGGYDGIGFAVPIHIAGWVGEQLVKTGSVKRGYLGIRNAPVNDDLAKKFKVNAREGVIVVDVFPGSPADKAGLEPGDVILSVNGKKIADPKQLQEIIERLDIGKAYTMHVNRGGKGVDLKVTVEEMPADFGLARRDGEPRSPSGKAFNDLGLELQSLTPELSKQFGFGTAKGVVVVGVKEDSPAAFAGIKQGDLIEKVGNTPVATVEEFEAAAKELSLKDGIVLHLRTAEGRRFVIVRASDED
jgi:serine protease Do